MKKIVIIGAGLAGLTALREFFRQHPYQAYEEYEIYIIEKRKLKFDRRQKIVSCPKRNLGIYSKYPVRYWDDYTKELFGQTNNTNFEASPNKLNRRQKFLRKMANQDSLYVNPITTHSSYKNFSIKDLQNSLLEDIYEAELRSDNIKLFWHTESNITKIDFSKKKINFESPIKTETINDFDIILNCSGSKGEITQLINNALPLPEQEKFCFDDYPLPTLYHCAVRLKLAPNAAKSSCSTDYLSFFKHHKTNYQHELVKKFKTLGLIQDELPNFYIIDDNFYKTKFAKPFDLRLFVASEIPKEIYNITDKNEQRATVIEWAKLIAAKHYSIPEQYFIFDDKGETASHQINALTFQNELKFMNKPVIELANGVKIFLIGDAAMSNFYASGVSSVLALNESCEVVRLIKFPNLSLKNYIEMYEYYKHLLIDEIEQLLQNRVVQARP